MVGIHRGTLRALLQKPEQTPAEGGMYLGNLGEKYGYGFAAWNMIWDVDNEAHPDPHRYAVRIYRFDRKAGRMVKIADLKTKSKYTDDRKALHKEFEMDYPNFFQSKFISAGHCGH